MITPYQFFFDFFPDAYVCAMMPEGGQFEGRVINEPGKIGSILKMYQELNSAGYTIHFTPNGVKSLEGRNLLNNMAKINAWWIDIDIDETKFADDEETQILREDRKAIIRGKIFASNFWPSLTIESRNGFHLYWFADGKATMQNWEIIGENIYHYYRDIGADRASVKVNKLMRPPNFYYYKNGERGKIFFIPYFSTFQRYSEEEMAKHFPRMQVPVENLLEIKPKLYKPKYTPLTPVDDIFAKVIEIPVDEVIQKLSGHWLVNGERLTIQRQDTEKSNILVDGRPSPNFIDRTQNHIYSNNAEVKGPTIVQYLDWYFPNRRGLIAKGLKELFTL